MDWALTFALILIRFCENVSLLRFLLEVHSSYVFFASFVLFKVDEMTVLSAGGVRFVSFCFVAWWVF